MKDQTMEKKIVDEIIELINKDIKPHLLKSQILEIIEKEFMPLRKEIEWGYLIPDMITGVLNQHPRAAIALRSGKEKKSFAEFYRGLVNDAEIV